MSQIHCTQPTIYKFFCLKIEIKTKADSYMPCEAMAHSTKFISGFIIVHESFDDL
jgi:hypothetical protein